MISRVLGFTESICLSGFRSNADALTSNFSIITGFSVPTSLAYDRTMDTPTSEATPARPMRIRFIAYRQLCRDDGAIESRLRLCSPSVPEQVPLWTQIQLFFGAKASRPKGRRQEPKHDQPQADCEQDESHRESAGPVGEPDPVGARSVDVDGLERMVHPDDGLLPPVHGRMEVVRLVCLAQHDESGARRRNRERCRVGRQLVLPGGPDLARGQGAGHAGG